MPVHLFGQSRRHERRSSTRRHERGIAGHRGRRAGDRRARITVGAVGGLRRDRLLLVLPEQEPRRVRRRRAWSPPTTTRWPQQGCGCCATTAMEPKYYHQIVGGNFRLDALQAAVLRVKLPHLAAWTDGAPRERRRATAGCSPRPGLTGHRAPAGRGAGPVPHLQPVRDPRAGARRAARAPRRARGIGTEIYYPVPFHLQECFADLGYKAGRLPDGRGGGREVAGAARSIAELTEAQQACGRRRTSGTFYRG